MKALVLGRGKSGAAAAALLRAAGHEVDFADGYGLVVASPGIPVKSELQVGCEELKRRGWKLLAVTGSKGKSSVVKVVADAIGGIACGNYGRPVSDLVGEPPGWAVVEVSSFQLETTALGPDAFEAAAVLNLQEDHLDRHGSVAAYHAVKRRLLGFARRGLAGAADVADAAANARLLAGSYFDNDVLRANGLVAAELMRVAGLDDAAIAAAFRAFVPLPHRMSPVAERDGVRFVDDSKATSVAALAAGVIMAAQGAHAPVVRLIAGGQLKGDDPKIALPALTKWVKKVYLMGQGAKAFFDAWSGAVDCEVCGTLERAVESAEREAARGDVVLMSPGAASFDQFASFEERGEVFARLVKKERKER